VGTFLPLAIFPGNIPAEWMLTWRWGWARSWERKEGSPPFVHPPTELSSTAASQDRCEGRGSNLSIHSLPSGSNSPFPTEEQPVASWALSFERLLQDPLGLAYFTVSPGVGWRGEEQTVDATAGRGGRGTGEGLGRTWPEWAPSPHSLI
jgi:hypothetical protein